MCKIASFFIHQLHFWLLLLLNVTCVTQIAGEHCCPNDSNQLKTQSPQIDASKNASSTIYSNASTLHVQAARRNQSLNTFNQLNSLNQTSDFDMQTNLDHLNELNSLNNNLIYTDQYVVELKGGPELAKELSEKHGFLYLGQIFDDHYHLKHRRLSKRSLEPAHFDLHRTLINEPNVNYIKQQTLKKRVKRDFVPIKPYTISHHAKAPSQNSNARFNDPQWPSMWYLSNRGLDMNVQKVWDMNITGKGVVVTILDDGLEKDHPDIALNYDEKASFDVNNLDDDPQPRYDMLDSNRHGTRCAGEVAAVSNNNYCGVGIAYDSKIGGVRMLDGDVTDAVEARSLSLQNQHIDIYSASWGPDDDGKTVDGPGELATRAFVEGVTKGRGGLGSIFIWASGNGGREHDNCNCDGYTNSIWTLSISSATENGLIPWYSESCSSTLATTYSSGAYGEKQIITTDLHHRCTTTHTGTSASAPLAAGIIALCLESNPRLTWRDMQHLVVQTANPGNLQANDWRINGIGKKVSHSFGYGLMDAKAMVDLAKEWVTVPPQKICETRSNPIDKAIPTKSYVELSLEVHCDKVRYLEHVQARLNLTTNRRGDIHIYLISPSGTRATLVAERPMDNSRAGFINWPFMSVHSWGEQPEGKWKLEIHNEGKYHNRANLKEWTLVMYGTSENPNRRRSSTNNAVNSRTFNNVLNRNENHRQSNNGRTDGILKDLPIGSLNKTKLTNIIKPILMKPNERPFESKNVSRSQLGNGHLVVSNDISTINQPDIENTHTSSNNQPTDQEPYSPNDIDKSTRAEKTTERKPVSQPKDSFSRISSRINLKQEQPIDPSKSNEVNSGSLLGEDQAAENSGLSQNRVAYGCSSNNFYFHGLCIDRCPDTYYGKEMVKINLDSLMTPINNQDFGSAQLVNSQTNRKRQLSDQLSLDQFKQFKELKELKELKEFKESKSSPNDLTTSSSSIGSLINQLNANNSNDSNDNPFNSKVITTTAISTLSSSTTSATSNQPTTIPPSIITNDQIPFFELPYISHFSIKQKDLNKNTLLRQQELTESFFNLDNSLYQQLVKESEQIEDGLQQHDLNSNSDKQAGDERLERISICLKCHYTCKKCTGRKYNQCTACYSDSQLSNGRCMFKDVIKNLNRLNQSTNWSAAMMIAFDPHLQNTITIFSLVLCLFFSIAFFYLLICRKRKYKPKTELKKFKNVNSNNLEYGAKQLPNTDLPNEQPSELTNLTDHSPHKSSSSSNIKKKSSSSFLNSFLRFFKLENLTSTKSAQKATNHLDNVKYKNVPSNLEDVVADNELNQINQSNRLNHHEINEEIT